MTQRSTDRDHEPSALLNSRDLRTALRSLADVLDLQQDELVRQIRSHDPIAHDPLEPIEDWTARDLLASLGRSDAVLERAVFYHGTRLIDPESVRTEGLLPLPVMLDRILAMLAILAAYRCDSEEWAAFRQWVEDGGGGHDGYPYRLKVADEIHHGPYAALIRPELLEHDRVGAHDYLYCPEIIQDIARCFDVSPSTRHATRSGLRLAHLLGQRSELLVAVLLGRSQPAKHSSEPPLADRRQRHALRAPRLRPVNTHQRLPPTGSSTTQRASSRLRCAGASASTAWQHGLCASGASPRRTGTVSLADPQ